MFQDIYEYLKEEGKKIRGNLCHNGRYVACDSSLSVKAKKKKDRIRLFA